MSEPLIYSNVNFGLEYTENYINTMSRAHMHKTCYEMYCLLRGNRKIYVEETFLNLQAGSVVIIAPGILHKLIEPSENNMYTRLLIYYDKNIFPPFLTKHLETQRFFPEKYSYMKFIDNQDFYDQIETIVKNMYANTNMFEFSIYSALIHLFKVVANERMENAISAKEALNKKNLIDLVSLYISTHLEEDLSLETLSRRFFVSPSYLSRIFKKKTEMPLSVFINQQKISRAAWLIQTNLNQPLSITAKQSGFATLSSFNRCFKEYMGCTPSELKRMLKNQDEHTER